MSLQSIEQQRAKHALEWAKNLGKNGGINDELLSATRKMAPMILMNGLGQTVAFYRSKNSGEHEKLYKFLSGWLVKEGKPYQNQQDLLDGITEEDAAVYRAAQAEALALLKWGQKFIKAYHIPKKTAKGARQDEQENG